MLQPIEPRQYTSIAFTERLAEAGIDPSVGSVGDAYDKALAESVIGLFKTELIKPRGPWRTVEQVESKPTTVNTPPLPRLATQPHRSPDAPGDSIVTVARELLETEGPEALTMRRLAAALGIRAPSLYKHLPHKTALETAIVIDGFEQAATAFEAATRDADQPMTAFVAAYRAFAAAHPHVYRLMTDRPLPRADMPSGLEARAAAPLLRAAGSPARARAAWAFIHGMIMLELNERFPDDGLTELAWHSGIAALAARE